MDKYDKMLVYGMVILSIMLILGWIGNDLTPTEIQSKELIECKIAFCSERGVELRERLSYIDWSENIVCYDVDGKVEKYYPKDIWELCGIELKPRWFNYLSISYWLYGGE